MNDANEILTDLEDALGISGARLSLTDHGTEIARRLGTAWFVSAVEALRMAHPGVTLDFVLEAVSQEPFPRPVTVQPGTAGGMYGEGRAVGRLTIPARDAGSSLPAVARVLLVPSLSLLQDEGNFEFIAPTSLKRRVAGRVYKELYSRSPLLLDRWRQNRNSKVIDHRSQIAPKSPALAGHGTPPVARPTGKPVVWIATHWLEGGGAESWAFEAAQIAKDSGFEVVITADVAAPQRALDRALSITDHVFIASNVLAEEDWGSFMGNLLGTYPVALVHIHHSARVYGYLPELRHQDDSIVVIDSTHIVEHRTGGFVRSSIEYSHHIDEHHVISPELRDLYLLDSRISPEKVKYHPLTSAAPDRTDAPAPRAEGPLRIGFLGRLAPQKRPFLFVEMVNRLYRAFPGHFSFVMQGSGVLNALTSNQIAKKGLDSVIERRDWGPVETFLDEIDVLVVSSDNEGLTLTTLEAEQHGVLVLSADVGSQRTVIAPQLLVSREPNRFLKESVEALAVLASVPGAFEQAAQAQTELVTALRDIPPASSYLSDTLLTLKEPS